MNGLGNVSPVSGFHDAGFAARLIDFFQVGDPGEEITAVTRTFATEKFASNIFYMVWCESWLAVLMLDDGTNILRVECRQPMVAEGNILKGCLG